MPAVFPIQWGPLVKSGRYPHMARRDAPVWERFLDKHGRDFEAVAYDVAVGGVLPATPGISDQEARGWRYSTALRADAVLRRGEVWTAIEVRPETSVSAVGAALCYLLVFQREFPEQPFIEAGVVTEFLTPDMQFCLDNLLIRWWKV